MKKTFFKSDSERELWIKLNAERQVAWEKSLTYFNSATGKYLPTLQALNPRSIEEALEISRGQLEYDEENKESPRFSLTELLTLNTEELTAIQLKQHQDFCKQNFGELR